MLGLKNLSRTGLSVDGCYMKELGSCDGKLSGEHLISESVIRVLKDGGDFSVSGVPWLPAGVTKVLGAKSFVANCLCRKHNSSLSPLDDAAGYAFKSLKTCLDQRVEGLHLISGHDLERWLLKTAKVLAVSKNLARGNEPLSGDFSAPVDVLDMLDDLAHWPERTGLYCVMQEGHLTHNHNRFQLSPFTNAKDAIVGLTLNILGLDFILVLDPTEFANRPMIGRATYRPNQILVDHPEVRSWIAISWEDGLPHPNSVSLRFLKNIP